jgi:CRP/FNR family cyclic AMP-dependent transcriptional regulator
MDVSFIQEIPIFSELDEGQIVEIQRYFMPQTYKKDNMILIEEEVGSSMFIITAGRIKISRLSDDGREVILSILSEGDFFGEMSILDGQTRSATAVALDDSELLLIRRDDFLKMLHSFPQIAINLLRELASRLRRADAQIKSLSLQDATGKVASTILRRADDAGRIKHGMVEISELPLQQDLANMSGTSRETISRVIKSLCVDGYLRKEGGKLVILDYNKFKEHFS